MTNEWMHPAAREAELASRSATAPADARLIERVVGIVRAEEEMAGPMPDDLWARCATREGAAEVMRAAVRATKNNIIAAVYDLTWDLLREAPEGPAAPTPPDENAKLVAQAPQGPEPGMGMASPEAGSGGGGACA